MNDTEIKPLLDKLGLKIVTALDYFEDNEIEMAKQKVEEAYDLRTQLYDIVMQFIKDAKEENVALYRRLENSLELPCKIDDTVYEVFDKCDGHDCPYNGYYGQWRCDYEGKRRCKPFIAPKKFSYCDIPHLNKTIFVHEDAANNKLLEIESKYKDI